MGCRSSPLAGPSHPVPPCRGMGERFGLVLGLSGTCTLGPVEARGQASPADESVVFRFMQNSIWEVAPRGRFDYYGAVTRMPGFIRPLIGRIAELNLGQSASGFLRWGG